MRHPLRPCQSFLLFIFILPRMIYNTYHVTFFSLAIMEVSISVKNDKKKKNNYPICKFKCVWTIKKNKYPFILYWIGWLIEVVARLMGWLVSWKLAWLITSLAENLLDCWLMLSLRINGDKKPSHLICWQH